jgi:hypothetical protein
MRWHPDYEANFKPIRRFLEVSANTGRITDWVVVWPLVQRPVGSIPVAGRDVPVIYRSRRPAGRTDFVGSDAKHRPPLDRLTGWGSAATELEPALADLRTVDNHGRPVTGGLLAYLVYDRPRPEGQPAGDLAEPGAVTLLLSYIAPTAAVPKGGSVILWTVSRAQQEGIAAVAAS